VKAVTNNKIESLLVSVEDAAKLLGWGRNTLTRKIKELGMDEPTAGAA
jgi:DNA-binding NtrC family response regulator